jgi:hypothetical protein
VDSLASEATTLRAGRSAFDSRQGKTFLVATTSQPAVTGVRLLGENRMDFEAGRSSLSTIHLLPRLRMPGAIPPPLYLHGVVLG